jgi:general secretion pathway protein G
MPIPDARPHSARPSAARSREAGFTLIELVIVMAIIALLAALVGPRLMDSLGDSQAKATGTQIELLGTALDKYRLDNGSYPTSDQGLKALVEKPDGVATWAGPYLRKRTLPKDGWGNDFQYQRPASRGGIEYDLYSLGADGKPGGEGPNADLGNW